MSFSEIEELLTNRIGLQSDILGHEVVARAVRTRMELSGSAQYRDYLSLLDASQSEFEELVAAVTVPETWFLRDEEPYAFLATYLQEVLRSPERSAPLSILSIPCSSGEEPYSIAMVLHECGMSQKDFTINAVDVNRYLIERAQRGIYGNNAFRAKSDRVKESYFTPKADGYHIKSFLRQSVQFRVGNILDLDLVCPTSQYDIIFCRNVLIYFSTALQRSVLETLHQRLATDGRLFLGHAEMGKAVVELFESTGPPGAFVYSKRPAKSRTDVQNYASVGTASQSTKQRKAKNAKYKRLATEESSLLEKKLATATATALDVRNAILHDIEALANDGRLVEAAKQCQLLLDEQADNSQAYYMCALVSEAQGEQAKANELYRKAITVDPSNYQAVAHLAASLEAQGDLDEASRLREQARRLSPDN